MPKILLVNSDIEQLKKYANSLTKHGISVLAATIFEYGKEIIIQKMPDIAIFFIQEDELMTAQLFFNQIQQFPCKIIITNTSNSQGNFIGENNNPSLTFYPNLINENNIYKICTEQLNAENKASASSSNADTSEHNVLLIEDNALNQLYFSEILNKLKLKHKVCDGILEAEKLLLQENFSLIISDVSLKDGNGIDFLNHFLASNEKHMPFILISGYSEKELTQKYGTLKCDVFLAKPINRTNFTKAVCSSLNIDNPLEQQPTNTSKQYNYQSLLEILKNDKAKIDACLTEFMELIEKSFVVSIKVLENGQLNEMRPLFHDLLNLCPYFGADLLYQLIMTYRGENDIKQKMNLLALINEEIKEVKKFYGSVKI